MKYSPQLDPFVKSYVKGQAVALFFPLMLAVAVHIMAGSGLYFFMFFGAYQSHKIVQSSEVWFDVFTSDDRFDGDKQTLQRVSTGFKVIRGLYVAAGVAMLAHYAANVF